MTTEKEGSSVHRRARKYIPHLARFYFRPSFDWTVDEARTLYADKARELDGPVLDRVLYEDCIGGMKNLPSECVDLVIADPPFGIDFDGRSGAYNRVGEYVVSGYREVMDSYDLFTKQWLSELPRLMKQQASAYVFSGWNNLESVLKAARETGFTLINHLIWKYQFGVYTKRRFVTSHYHILLLVKNPEDYFFNKHEHYPQDVWRIRRRYRMGQTKNGTKLPVELVSRCIDFSSRPGDVVFDPFMGNGTTAVAAKSNWRHYVGFEINSELKSIIESEVSPVEAGQTYRPYTERLPSLDELAKRYPSAYKEYVRAGTDNPDRTIGRSIIEDHALE